MTATASLFTSSRGPTQATRSSPPTSAATRSARRADMTLRRPAHLIAAAVICLCGLWAVPAGQAQDDSGIAYSIELDGDISPATEAWIGSALDDAADEGAEIAIIRLDT